MTGDLATRNLLLRALPAPVLQNLLHRAERTELPIKTTIMVADKPVSYVYFVETGIMSMIALLEDGNRIEIGLAGPEGMVGLPLLLNGDPAAHECFVQVEGAALRLRAADFRNMVDRSPELLNLLLRYAGTFHTQVAQTAACNGRHELVQRLARWLLMVQDRCDGDRFTMTQEFMSVMLGVRRPGVTIAVGTLQKAGLITHTRGTLTVLNRPGLEAAACSCYEAIQTRYAWLDQRR